MTMQTMTDYQKRLRDEAAQECADLQIESDQAFQAGADFWHSKAKVLVEALEIAARGETQWDGVEAMHAARAALREYRGSE